MGGLPINYNDTDDFRLSESKNAAIFKFDTGEASVEVELHYSDEDEMLWGEAPFDGPLTSLLKRGQSVTLTEVGSQKTPLVFSLKSSASALTAVESTCSIFSNK
jgi:hypothetical protein